MRVSYAKIAALSPRGDCDEALDGGWIHIRGDYGGGTTSV